MLKLRYLAIKRRENNFECFQNFIELILKSDFYKYKFLFVIAMIACEL